MLKATPEDLKKAQESKAEVTRVKKKYEIPSSLACVRANCIDCMGGSSNAVKECNIPRCTLYPYRFGKGPTEERLEVYEFDSAGKVTGTRPYQGYKTE